MACLQTNAVLALVSVVMLFTLPTVKSTWTLQFRLVHYTNPSEIDFQGVCCDLIALCLSPCDVYFTFCLRSINTSPTNTQCDQFITSRGHTTTSNYLYPPATGPLYSGSSLSNPMQFTGNSWSGSFQMLVTSEDEDIDADDLIDRNPFNQVMSPTGVWTNTITVPGIYDAASIAMQFRLYCDQYYYTASCNVYCKPRDDNGGHYTCNSDGTKNCRSGWTNPNNNCLTAICATGCANGNCALPGQCVCTSGWQGQLCNQCIPKPGCSQQHGSCNSPGQCNCDTGYGGANCDQDLDVCGHQQPCLHGATCNNEGADQHSCLCAPGYTGGNCQSDINECGPLPCLNGATCEDNLNHFACLCAPGWTGGICDVNIDDCDPNPCQNGNCTDMVNGYTCQCEPGWTGANCSVDINECDILTPCQNDGSCTDMVNGFTCQCVTGWTGKTCTENIDDCNSNPCQNGGNCTDLLAGYRCNCAPGYFGENCEDHYCRSTPCKNGANCTILADGYMCTCPYGLTGINCTVDIDDCASTPCNNNGTCRDLLADYVCACPANYRGRNCEFSEQIPACNPNPCPRGLTCAEGRGTEFVCIQCSDTGSECQIVIDSAALAANSTKPVNAMVIGAAVGGIGGALLLGCMLILLIAIGLCCCKRSSKNEEVESNDELGDKGYVDNPSYLSTNSLVSHASVKQRYVPYDIPDCGKDVPNPLYASSSTTPWAPGDLTLLAKSDGKENSDASLSNSQGEKRNNVLLNMATSTAQFSRSESNLYTYDPTEEDDEVQTETALKNHKQDGVYSEINENPFPQLATGSVENVYEPIPGDLDPSSSSGIYEKLPPPLPEQ